MKKVFYSLLMVAAVIWGFWFAGRAYKNTHFTGNELELYGALQTACAGGWRPGSRRCWSSRRAR